MNLRLNWFNNYLWCVLLAVAVAGCASASERKKNKEASTLRLYLEATSDGGDRTAPVPIYRADPVPVVIEKSPFLDEGHIIDAAVVDVVGGFAIKVKFDFHGQLALETASTSKKGAKVAVYSQWTEGRWLAAPRMSQRISDGVFVFTPDATRAEAERIVNGLNNVAIELKNKPKPKK